MKWKESIVDLVANQVIEYPISGKANAVLLWNPDLVDFVYLSVERQPSAVSFDTRVNPLMWGIVARPFDLRMIYLFAGVNITGLRLIEIYSDNPLGLLMSMVQEQAIAANVAVTQTVGLRAAELNLDAERDLQVDVKTMPLTQLAAGSAVAISQATPGVSNKVVAELAGSIETVNSAPVVGRKTVTATAAEIFAGGSVKASRRKLVVRNEDPVMRLRVGPSGVTQQNGFPVEPVATVEYQFDPATAIAVFALSEGASLPVSVWEV